jgi:outer membrane protein OmpA-like peptidoglycan-associated protein
LNAICKNFLVGKVEELAMKLFSKLTVVLMVLMLVLLAGCSDNEKAMVDAVKNGDTAKVQSLLDKGVSPNLKTDDGKSILMLAAYLGHADIAKLLIDKGADVNARDKAGKTALMYSAEKGNIEIAKLLLENGADIDATDNNGRTALEIARENNQAEMVEFLSNWGKSASTPMPTVTPNPTPEPTVVLTSTPEPTEVPASTPEPTVAPTSTPEPAVVPVASLTPVPVPTPEPLVNLNKQLRSVFFDFDKSILRSSQVGTMEDNLAILQENPNIYIILGGHADDRGTREYNQALSERRAQTLQKYLIDNGIAPERIIVYSYGKDHLLKRGNDEASRSYNRRVDILEWETIITREQVIDETIKQ